MGVLRFVFALSVLLFHIGVFRYTIINNQVAVCSFFVISGFYMALILEKKYKGKNFLFWSNRFLRIFPLYWITLLVTFLFVLVKFYFHLGTSDNAIVHYLHYSSSVSPISFIGNLTNYIVRNITLLITTDYVLPNDNTPGLLLVQQAWTLQIELLFYLLAPFLINLSTKKLILCTLGYLLIYFGGIVPFHLVSSKTLVFIFLNYFVFFIFGIMTFKYIYTYIRERTLPKKLTKAIYITFFIFLVTYTFFPSSYTIFSKNIMDVLYFLLFIVSLPFIFKLTMISQIDAFIGELSYPLYITHFFVIKLFSNSISNNPGLKAIGIIVVSIFISIIIAKYIEVPIDTWRQMRLLLTKSGVSKKKKV